MEAKYIIVSTLPSLNEEPEMIEITNEEANRIEFISSVIEENPEEEQIPLNLSNKMIKMILSYVRILDDIPEPTIEAPLKTNRFSDLVPEPIYKLLKIPKEELFNLMEAADFLQMDKLISIIGAKIVCQLQK